MKKSKDVFRRWKTRSLKFKIITGIATVFACLVIPFFLLAIFVMLVTSSSFAAVFQSGLFYGLYAGAILLLIAFALFEFRTLGSWRVKKVNKDLEDSHFMTDKEIASNAGFTVTTFEELPNVKDGVLIKAERTGDSMNIVLCDPIHATLIATTGTGKTTTYVEPFIEVLSRTATKPCMVIGDPKGELYARHAKTLRDNGYSVHIIDLTDTHNSSLWNPFNDVWRKTARIREEITQEKNKYKWGGRLYLTHAEAEQAKKEFTVKLNEEIYIDLLDLIYTMCPVEAAQDKSWQQGARDLILGMVLRMWEDVRDGYMPKEKFNLYNLWWNLTEYARGDCAVLKEYVDECADEQSRAKSMASTVLVSEDRTLSSYLGSVNQYLHWMADGGVAQLTSGNEIEFSEWDEEPNVLFIKIPDMKQGRHGLVSLMLLQLYKALDEKGEQNRATGATSDKCLKRHCYFLLDEFGSLPPIQGLDNIVKIARSLGAFWLPVLQDYAQLDKVYGDKAATTIKNNCNIKIFMGTNDDKTRNEISEACGKKKVKTISYNESKDMSVSTSAQSVPLIYPSELKNLNDPKNGVYGNAVIVVSGVHPIMSHTTPCFKAKDIYGIEDSHIPLKDFMFFDEETNRYDISRLIYLYQELNSEPTSPEEKVEELQHNIAEHAIEGIATKLLAEQVIKEIKDLYNEISEEDFIKLGMADTEGKIAILDELAERATSQSNMWLVAKIEKIISLLKYSSVSISDAGNVKEGANYHD